MNHIEDSLTQTLKGEGETAVANITSDLKDGKCSEIFNDSPRSPESSTEFEDSERELCRVHEPQNLSSNHDINDSLMLIEKKGNKALALHEALSSGATSLDSNKTRAVEMEGLAIADNIVQEVLARRDTFKTSVHLAIESFYCNLMIRDDPSLRYIPFAVFSENTVLATNNLAKFSGIEVKQSKKLALSLCPSLKLVPLYTLKPEVVVSQIQEILYPYTKKFKIQLKNFMVDLEVTFTLYITSPSYLDAVNIIDVVESLRKSVSDKTGLPTSAGAASTALLAKLASLVKRPNGFHYIQPTKAAEDTFLHGLPVSQYCGVSKDVEAILTGLEIYTTKDIWTKRATLYQHLNAATYRQLIGVCLGDHLEFPSAMQCNATPRQWLYNSRNNAELKKVCLRLVGHLENHLKSIEQGGKMFVMEIITPQTMYKTRGYSLINATNDSTEIVKIILSLLEKYLAEKPRVVIKHIRLSATTLENMSTKYNNPSSNRNIEVATAEQRMDHGEHVGKQNQRKEGREVTRRRGPKERPVQNTVPATSDAMIPTPIFKIPASVGTENRDLPRRFLSVRRRPYRGRKPKPYKFRCPNCDIKMKFVVAKVGEKMMIKHVNQCLFQTFPHLLSLKEPINIFAGMS